MASQQAFFRSRLVWCVLVSVVVLLVLSLCVRRKPLFNPEQFDRLAAGMTEAEVVTILGCPPGNYQPRSWRTMTRSTGHLQAERGWTRAEYEKRELEERVRWIRAGEVGPFRSRFTEKWWSGRYFTILVIFDDTAAVHLCLWAADPTQDTFSVWDWFDW
jgi:hypothetical protein